MVEEAHVPPGGDAFDLCLSATLFREKMLALADEYEIMHRTAAKSAECVQSADGPVALLIHRHSSSGLAQTVIPSYQKQRTPETVSSHFSPFSQQSDSTQTRGQDHSEQTHTDAEPPELPELNTPIPKGESEKSFDRELSEKKHSERAVDSLHLGRKKRVSPDRDHLPRGTAKLRMWCYTVVKTTLFDRLVSIVIFMNVVTIGISTDMRMNQVQDGSSDDGFTLLWGIETCFCLAYSIELAFRLGAYGKDFFLDPDDRAWNIFDLALVIQSVWDQSTSYMSDFVADGSLSYLRILRLVKMVKMLRVIRMMRSMREMRLILCALFSSSKSLFWSLSMLVVCLYSFGISLVQGATDFLVDTRGTDDSSRDNLVDLWGSVQRSMTTLFMSTTGGMDWQEAIAPLYSAGGFFVIIFLLYICIFHFVVLNIITALFVETSIEHANRDRQHNIQNELEKEGHYMESLRMLFDEMDESGDGEVSLEEFHNQMANPALVAFFASLDIEIPDAARFFEMLSDGGRKTVTLETFVKGCIRMRGQALAMDLHDLSNKHEHLAENMERFMVQLDGRLHSLALKTDLAELRRTVTKEITGVSFDSGDSDASNRLVHVV